MQVIEKCQNKNEQIENLVKDLKAKKSGKTNKKLPTENANILNENKDLK